MTKREQKKILTPQEASLVKGMFEHTSLNNQQILSYFIRPEYDVNQRVVSQIKSGLLHKDVSPASKEEVFHFIEQKNKKFRTNIEKFIETINVNKDGSLEECETKYIEFKNDFSADFNKLMRPMLGFANSEGGFIIYGVEDTRKICGMSEIKSKIFKNFDLKDLEKKIKKYASSEIKIEKQIVTFLGKKLGVLYVYPSDRKPVICLSTGDEMSTGRIYYRYNAETTEIRPAELEKIIEERTEVKIKNNFMKLLSSILKNGISNSLIINSQTGELTNLDGKNLVLPEDVLSKINLIKEGHFVENDGAPAYTLKGEVTATTAAIQEVKVPVDYSKTHPYTMKSFCKELTLYFKNKNITKSNITYNHVKNILYHLHLYNDDSCHHVEPHGAVTIHNLSDTAFKKVVEFLESKEDLTAYLKSISQFNGDIKE